MTAQHGPVVIVGAGPVGLACALLLAKRGVATVILERHREPYALPRAVHLDDEVFRLRLQQSMGKTDAPHKMSELRKDRARAKTLLRERELVASGESNG